MKCYVMRVTQALVSPLVFQLKAIVEKQFISYGP